MRRLKSIAMDDFGPCVRRAHPGLFRAVLAGVIAGHLVAFPSAAIAQPQDSLPSSQVQAEAQTVLPGSVNRDTVTGDNPDLAIPEPALRQPVTGNAPPRTDAAIITKASLGSLIDRDVDAAGGGNLGHIVDVLIDVDGEMRAVVIDIGGFLGVGNRRVAVASDLIQVSHSNPQAPLIMQVSAAVIRSAPEYKRGDMNISVLAGPRLPASGQAGAPATSSAETISVKTSVRPVASPPASPVSSSPDE